MRRPLLVALLVQGFPWQTSAWSSIPTRTQGCSSRIFPVRAEPGSANNGAASWGGAKRAKRIAGAARPAAASGATAIGGRSPAASLRVPGAPGEEAKTPRTPSLFAAKKDAKDGGLGSSERLQKVAACCYARLIPLQSLPPLFLKPLYFLRLCFSGGCSFFSFSDLCVPSRARAQVLAHAGVASRRAAELIISDGRVLVNGKLVTAPGTLVSPTTDRISVDGKAVALRPRSEVRSASCGFGCGCVVRGLS